MDALKIFKCIEICRKQKSNCKECEYQWEGFPTCMDGLREDLFTLFSSSDIEEVVRCKDCKWYDKDRSLCDNTVGLPLPREQDYYCADGIKREY